MKEVKTLKDVNELYKKFGLKKPKSPLDESLFPNGYALLKIRNVLYGECADSEKIEALKFLVK